MNQLGKLLIGLGIALVVAGSALLFGDKLGLGRLPGDITWRGKSAVFHFPLASSIIVSIVLTLLLNWWLRGRN